MEAKYPTQLNRHSEVYHFVETCDLFSFLPHSHFMLENGNVYKLDRFKSDIKNLFHLL